MSRGAAADVDDGDGTNHEPSGDEGVALGVRLQVKGDLGKQHVPSGVAAADGVVQTHKGHTPDDEQVEVVGKTTEEQQRSRLNCWESLLPAAVTRHVLSFILIADLQRAAAVCKVWRALLLLDEVCEDLATNETIFTGIQSHCKDVAWKDRSRGYQAFIFGYKRAVSSGPDLERWWSRYKITFCLSIPPLVAQGGPATCWTVENASWRFESGLLRGGFAFNVDAFCVNNWLSIPIQSGPIESLVTTPDTTFYTEATLIDKLTGKFAKLYSCADRDVALGRVVEVETIAVNGAVSAMSVREPYKRVSCRAVPGIKTRLRYEFTAFDWTTDTVRLRCTQCFLDLMGISYDTPRPPSSIHDEDDHDYDDDEEEEHAPWRMLKRWVEGLTWVS